HDDLAGNVNLAVLAARGPSGDPPRQVVRPGATDHHWRGIRARIHGFDRVRAARLDSDRNPAHPLANSPEEYAHVDGRPRRCVMPTSPDRPERIPPPSRADRTRSD
ncbi:MAG: ribonuclease H, partial [Halococcoides sp.]